MWWIPDEEKTPSDPTTLTFKESDSHMFWLGLKLVLDPWIVHQELHPFHVPSPGPVWSGDVVEAIELPHKTSPYLPIVLNNPFGGLHEIEKYWRPYTLYAEMHHPSYGNTIWKITALVQVTYE